MSTSRSLIAAVAEYLKVPEKNEEIVAAFLGGKKRNLVKELVSEGSTKTAAARQVERWVTGAQQKRNPANIRKETREKLTRILWQRRMPATFHVEGMIRYSKDEEWRAFDVPPETIPELIHLQGMLAVAKAAADHPDFPYEPEEAAGDILTGLYFGDPPEDIEAGGELVAHVPWNETFIYENCLFSVNKYEPGATNRRKGAA